MHHWAFVITSVPAVATSGLRVPFKITIIYLYLDYFYLYLQSHFLSVDACRTQSPFFEFNSYNTDHCLPRAAHNKIPFNTDRWVRPDLPYRQLNNKRITQ